MFALKVNVINCGAKSLYLGKDCFGGSSSLIDAEPAELLAALWHSPLVAFLDKVEKNAQMYILLLIHCGRGVWVFNLIYFRLLNGLEQKNRLGGGNTFNL